MILLHTFCAPAFGEGGLFPCRFLCHGFDDRLIVHLVHREI